MISYKSETEAYLKALLRKQPALGPDYEVEEEFWDLFEERKKFLRDKIFKSEVVIEKDIKTDSSHVDFSKAKLVNEYTEELKNALSRTVRFSSIFELIDMIFEKVRIADMSISSSVELETKEGFKFKYNEGMSLVKIIENFIHKTEVTPQNAESIRNIVDKLAIEKSKIKQSSGGEGKLAISIHPNDFLTLSDNDSGWGSCYTLSKLSSYAGSTTTLMQTPSVFVVYFHSGSNSFLKSEEYEGWNSKTWRMLAYLTPEGLMFGNQYPFSSSFLEDEAISMVLEQLEEVYIENPMVEYTTNKSDAVYNDLERKNSNYRRFVSEENFDRVKNIHVPIIEDKMCMFSAEWYRPYSGSVSQITIGRGHVNLESCSECGEIFAESDLDENYNCEDCREEYNEYLASIEEDEEDEEENE